MLKDSIAAELESRFEAKQLQNPLYSLRAFARDLGVSSGQLSMILSKKRGVSVDAADRMAEILKLNAVEKKYFVSLAAQDHSRSARTKERAKEKATQIKQVNEGLNLTSHDFSLISEWYHMAILQVMQLRGYEESAREAGEIIFIAQRLNLAEDTVTLALERLRKLGAIELHGEYHLPVADFVMVQGAYPNAHIKRFHQQTIQKAIEALNYQQPESFAFKTTLLSIDAHDCAQMKEELSEFCKQLMIRYGKTRNSAVKPNQVYLLTQQFFKVAEVDHD